jgi:hypothetical protein
VTVHRHFFILAPNTSDRSHLASSACLEVRHGHDRSSQRIVVTRARYRCVLITNFQGCACVRWSKKSTRPTVPTQRSAETVQIPRPNGGIRFLGRRHIQYRQAHTYTLLEAVSHRGGSWRRSRVQHTVYVFGRLYQQIIATPDAHNAFRRIGLWRHFMHFALELTRITTASNMIS